MQEYKKKEVWLDWGFFGLGLLFFSGMMLYLFYRQTTGSPALYPSDMKAYILQMQGLDSGYSFPYPVFFKISAFFHWFCSPEMAVALATMVLNALSMVLMKLAVNRIVLEDMRKALKKYSYLAGICLSLVTFSLFYVSMVYPPKGIYLPGIQNYYLGIFTPNPFHNATYLAVRPFTILVFFQFAGLLSIYEEGYGGRKRKVEKGVSLWDYVLFSVSLLLATMTKPSFTLVFVAAAGLIMLYRLCRARFRNFLPSVQLGLCFVPTFLDLLYQYKGVFVPEPGQEGGVGFGIATAWSLHCDNIPLGVGLAMGFPILVLLINFRELKDNAVYRFSWQLYAMSFATVFFLYEKGFRLADMNFSWGYMHGIFFAFVGAMLVLLKSTAKKSKPGWLLTAQWLAYGWHLVCGIYYFSGIYAGRIYY